MPVSHPEGTSVTPRRLVAAVHAELGVEVPHVQFVAYPLLPPLSAPLIRAFPHPVPVVRERHELDDGLPGA